MLRTNLILLVCIVLCALAAITSQHKARKLFQALEHEQERVRQVEVEFGQLQLELSTWAAHSRVEKLARERLRMAPPDGARLLVAPLAEVGR